MTSQTILYSWVESWLTPMYQTQTIPGIGIEVLVFWPVLVLVLVLKILNCQVLVLVLVLKNWFFRYWYWDWYWPQKAFIPKAAADTQKQWWGPLIAIYKTLEEYPVVARDQYQYSWWTESQYQYQYQYLEICDFQYQNQYQNWPKRQYFNTNTNTESGFYNMAFSKLL